ncbi:MAG TPA: winged helix-turn-helix transcriptional regulator [Methanomicrobia archaeon]|nr:winged helix-turn-helix transcriptional regulator [Methanomicrobia archaeon]
MKTAGILYLVLLFTAIATPTPGLASDGFSFAFNDTGSYSSQLILDIYVDETGKALVIGYVNDPESLPFLQTADYIYEIETQQLYAITHALTEKSGERWMLTFTTTANYSTYQAVFYLPPAISLGRITCSDQLEYLVSTANESLVVEFHGYEVQGPGVWIAYQQPLTTPSEATGVNAFDPGYVILIVLLAIVSLMLSVGFLMVRLGSEPGPVEKPRVRSMKIKQTPAMARTMETLTDRERAIVNALLKHNGEMTQSDLRHETEIPKSSLNSILRALERGQIIKKNAGRRKNVIELTEWFLSGNGGEKT